MTVNRIPLDELHNNEFVQAIEQGCSFVATNNPNTTPAIEARRLAAAGYVPVLKVLFSNDPASEKTAMIVAEDRRRDGYVTGIKTIALGNTYFDEDMSIIKAGNEVLRAFKKHGKIIRESYNEETAIINQIILESETGTELIAAISTLKLGNWFTALKKTNKAVNDLYVMRIKEQGDQPQDDPFVKRNEAKQAYQYLMDGIDSAADLDETGSYTSLINYLNELAAKYETTLAARKTNNTKTPPPTN